MPETADNHPLLYQESTREKPLFENIPIKQNTRVRESNVSTSWNHKRRGRHNGRIAFLHRLDLHPTGKPQQNAYVERYNRAVRTEWLA